MENDALSNKIEILLKRVRLRDNRTSTPTEYQLENGSYVKVVESNGCSIVLDGDSIPIADGSHALNDERKLIVGVGGILIKILQHGQSESAILKVVRDKEKEDKLWHLSHNIKDVIAFRNS